MNDSRTLHGVEYDALDQIRALARANGGKVIVNSFTEPAAVPVGNLPAGIQFFDFDTVGKKIFPIISKFRNRLPRRQKSGTALYWREVQDINVNKIIPGVSEGNRNAVITRSTKDRFSTFAGLGMENVSTFESQYAAQGVANIKELARVDALQALMMAEERVLVYGNSSYALGTPATPSGVAAAGGAMSARAAVVCRVVALTGEGRYLATTGATGAVQKVVARTNADGSSDNIGGGSSMKSNASAAVNVALNNKVTWTVTDIPQAMHYAWYTGAAGAEKLAGITDINVFVQTTDEPAGAQAVADIIADNSVNALEYNGIYTQIIQGYNDGAEAYFKSLNGAALTADSAGNINEIIAAFYHFWSKWFISPSSIVVNGATAYEITKILLSSTAAPIYAAQIKQDAVTGGFYVTNILNPFTNTPVPLEVHPFLPNGTIMFFTDSIPYPVEGLGSLWEVGVRQEYYGIDWPLRTRKTEAGVYCDEGLIGYAPFVQGVIKNALVTVPA